MEYRLAVAISSQLWLDISTFDPAMIDITPALADIASALARYRLAALGSQECRIVMYSLARKNPWLVWICLDGIKHHLKLTCNGDVFFRTYNLSNVLLLLTSSPERPKLYNSLPILLVIICSHIKSLVSCKR